MLDVEVPAGVDPAHGGAPRSGAAAWAEQRRPVLIALAFGVAIVLGVVIGLAWAPDNTSTTTTAGEDTKPNDAVLSPPLPVVPWEGARQVGRASSLRLSETERSAIREPLQWLVAYHIRQATGQDTPVAADVTITEGTLYYGAIEGTDRESDVFWAVALTEVKGVAQQPPDPHVWKRTGSAPWELVASGEGACSQVPAPLIQRWGGAPISCGPGVS